MLAPDLLWVECANILWKYVRRAELTEAEAALRLEALRVAAVQAMPCGPLLLSALRLAVALRHPVHDCLYLEAARAVGLPLVTADRALARLPQTEVAVMTLDQLP